MSRRGAWLLKRLRLQYCDWGGSSAGLREFVESGLPAFRAANPQIEVETAVRRNRHPLLVGDYVSGVSHPVGVKNLPAPEVEAHVAWLRSSGGRRATTAVPSRRQYNRTLSVQGRWTPETFASGPAAAGAAAAGGAGPAAAGGAAR